MPNSQSAHGMAVHSVTLAVHSLQHCISIHGGRIIWLHSLSSSRHLFNTFPKHFLTLSLVLFSQPVRIWKAMMIFISLVRYLKTRRLEHLVLLSGDGERWPLTWGDSLNIVTAWLFFNPLNSCLKLTIHYPQTPDESEPRGEEAEFVVWVLGPHQLPALSSEGIAFFPSSQLTILSLSWSDCSRVRWLIHTGIWQANIMV